MKEITFLEQMAENLLEGGFARLLRPKLQPVQIAKALAKEMEQRRLVSADAPLVANRYAVHLHPADFALFAGFRASLERELAAYLRGYATRGGLRPLGTISVELLSKEDARQGRVSVEGSFKDHEELAPSAAPVEAPAFEGTASIPVVAPARSSRAPSAPAFLLDPEGREIRVGADGLSIGRAVDNDLVLEDRGVSRHHARIVRDANHYVLVDLDSTNGSFVGDCRVSRQALSDGDNLSFGGRRFVFRTARG